MYVTATEFKTNFGKYLELISKGDIFITKNGKAVAKLTSPTTSIVKELRGCITLPSNIPDKELLENLRLERYENID